MQLGRSLLLEVCCLVWTSFFRRQSREMGWDQHWRQPFTEVRWHHVPECAFVLGPVWLSLLAGVFSLTPCMLCSATSEQRSWLSVHVFAGARGEMLALRWTWSIITLSWRKGLFPGDWVSGEILLSLRRAAVHHLAKVRVQNSALSSGHLICPGDSLLLVAPEAIWASPQRSHAGTKGSPAAELWAWLSLQWGSQGAMGNSQLGSSGKGQRLCWKSSLAFHFLISTNRRQSWALRRWLQSSSRSQNGAAAAARLTALRLRQPLTMFANV